MAKIGKNEHFWTFQPELGQNYEYCDRCNKVRNIHTGEIMTWNQAIKMVKDAQSGGDPMIKIENILPKPIKRQGNVFQPKGEWRTTYNAEIEPGKSIRLTGFFGNVLGDPKPIDKAFRVGDWASYDSYNLVYVGKIVSISDKAITIQPEGEQRNRRLSLYDFAWRNWNFDLEVIRAENDIERQHI